MKRHTLRRLRVIPGMTVLFLLALIGMAAPLSADEGISVECYAAGSQWNLGTVMVFDVVIGAQVCNSMYLDCRGRCIGCFHDNDYVRDTCVDINGNLFFR